MSNKLGAKKQREQSGFTLNLHVYSAGCSWHGPISAVGKSADLPKSTAYVGGKEITIGGPGSGIPCCPHCGSMLYQTEEANWWKTAKEHEAAGHPNYVRFLNWGMKQHCCWIDNTNTAMSYNTDPENKGFQYTHVTR
jgi:hypothetical protein